MNKISIGSYKDIKAIIPENTLLKAPAWAESSQDAQLSRPDAYEAFLDLKAQ